MTKLIGHVPNANASTLQPECVRNVSFFCHVPDMRWVADANNRHGSGRTMNISRFVHSIFTCMATTGRLVANLLLFCLVPK